MGEIEDWLSETDDFTVFLAYNSNVDALTDVDRDLQSLLDPPREELPERIETSEDLSTAIVRSMEKGEGDELPLTSDFEEWLENHVEVRRERVGGQAGIMADVLSVLGAEPVLYTYMLSERQKSVFRNPERIRFPRADNGLEIVPLEDVRNSEETKVNWVFEFDTDQKFFGVEPVKDSRFIAASRLERFNLEPGRLQEKAQELGNRVDAAILSGYHDLKKSYSDGSTFEDHIETGREFIRSLRNGNDITVQIEYGVTHNEDLRQSIANEIAPESDVVSLDSHELHFLCRDLGIKIPEDDIASRYRALRDIRDELGVPAVKLHARDYFLASSEGYRAEDYLAEGFRFASVVAAAKALTGTVNSASDLREGAEVKPSEKGVKAVQDLMDGLKYGDLTRGGKPVAVPNRVVGNPESTVGIGDAASASSFVLENARCR
ncbi:MAG: ADP-dependent glucokinase/phosphofructokinase [Candidatus Nanohaloarchaea archaeon]|nr:ADP-dependent glucokinase/phosphofructokinase [Candidatus Nanohaloarchaea archaeon]